MVAIGINRAKASLKIAAIVVDSSVVLVLVLLTDYGWSVGISDRALATVWGLGVRGISSETPVGLARDVSTSTSAMGLAGELGAPAATLAIGDRDSARSSMVPHARHSGQRPTHFATSKPHSAQRKLEPFLTTRRR